VGAFILAARIHDDAEFRAWLFQRLPAILIFALVVKLSFSAWAFRVGLRRKAVTPAAVGWIVGGWLAAGLYLAFFARRATAGLAEPGTWISCGMFGFWLLPLADLALAPLTLISNRHR